MVLTVLQIVPSLRIGGVETGTVDLALALMAKGHRAIVISSGGPLTERLEAAGVIHVTLPVHRKAPWTILRMVPRVAELIESHGVDVVHVRSRVPAIVGFLAWRRMASKVSFREGHRQRIPVFLTTAHGYYSRHLFSRIMGWGRFVIAISERIARRMIDDFGVPPERVRLVPRGVELEKFSWAEPRRTVPNGEWIVAVIGRITPIKGHRELIRAFQIVSKSFPKARLKIVGEPANESALAELKGLVNRLELGERVEFVGREPDIPRLMSHLDLVVLPSTGQEAFGRVLIEAGAAGVPVVATEVGGVSEVVVDRKTGLLVPPADPVALAAGIVTLLKDRNLAVELSQAARRRVESLFSLGRMVDQTLKVYEEASQRLKILVIKLSAIGDVALATPSLRALRARFPKAQITVLVGREARELLHRCPYLDDLIVFDSPRDGSPLGLLRLGTKLAKRQVDLVVDFQNNRVSHWLGLLSGAPQRYGYAGRRWSRLLTHSVKQSEVPTPPVEQQFRLLRALGIQGASDPLELWPGPSDEAKAGALIEEAWVAENQPLVVVHPGGHPRWLSKRWPPSRYAQLIDRLATVAKARVILTGSSAEARLAEEIHRSTHAKPILAVGRTSLNELAALVHRADCFVGGDTAALHIAAAVGTPLVALYGSTDPVRHLPPTPKVKLLKKQLPCSPCYHRRCPRVGSGQMECMRLITVDEVLQAVLSLLKGRVVTEEVAG